MPFILRGIALLVLISVIWILTLATIEYFSKDNKEKFSMHIKNACKETWEAFWADPV